MLACRSPHAYLADAECESSSRQLDLPFGRCIADQELAWCAQCFRELGLFDIGGREAWRMFRDYLTHGTYPYPITPVITVPDCLWIALRRRAGAFAWGRPARRHGLADGLLRSTINGWIRLVQRLRQHHREYLPSAELHEQELRDEEPWREPLDKVLSDEGVDEATEDDARRSFLRVRQEVLGRLCLPPRRTRRNGVLRVRVMEWIDFLVDTKNREIRAEFREFENGPAQPLADPHLTAPIGSALEFEPVVMSLLQQDEPRSERRLHDLTCIITNALLEELRPLRVFDELNRAIGSLLTQQLPGRLLRWGRQEGYPELRLAESVSITWQELEVLDRVERETPALLSVHLMMRRYGALAPFATTRDMRSSLLTNGLKPASWRQLCQQGSAFFQSVRRVHGQWPQWERLQAHMFLLSVGDGWLTADDPIVAEAHRSVVGATDLMQDRVTMFLLAASRHAGSLTPEQREAFLQERFHPMLIWATRYADTPDKNQRRAGWRFWDRRFLRWITTQSRENPTQAWSAPPSFEVFVDDQRVLVHPLSSFAEMLQETTIMKHCVVDYVGICAAGSYLVASMTTPDNRRRASLGLRKTDGRFVIDQLTGVGNARPTTLMVQAAQSARQQINEWLQSTCIQEISTAAPRSRAAA